MRYSPAGAPTRARYKVVGFLVAMAAITYFDRVCISTLTPEITRDLGLSRVQMSLVFSAFAVAYAAFEIPTAWLAERIGTRHVLARIVAWWSAFTLATAAAMNLPVLLVTRFLFGAGEAGAWPNAARAFSRWIPAHERGRVQGIFFAGAHLAGGITPWLVGVIAPWAGWRGTFVVFSLLGFTWAYAWFRWFRDDPADHSATNEAERALIHGTRREDSHKLHGAGLWRSLAANRNLLPLCAAYFANSYGFYFLITWLPSYLSESRGMEKSSLSLYAGLPLLLSVVADLFGGVTTDRLASRYGIRVGRAAIGCVAYALAAASMLAATVVIDGRFAAILIALASAASMFTLGASWAACIDIGGEHSGVLSAAMNTSGQVGAILSPLILAWIVERSGNWAAPLIVMGALYVIASLAWLFVNPNDRLWDNGQGAP